MKILLKIGNFILGILGVFVLICMLLMWLGFLGFIPSEPWSEETCTPNYYGSPGCD